MDIFVHLCKPTGALGYCLELENNRTFELEIDRTLPLRQLLETVAHEMVHHMQNLDDRLTPTSGEDGSPDENEANSLAAVIMRKFGRENPDIYE